MASKKAQKSLQINSAEFTELTICYRAINLLRAANLLLRVNLFCPSKVPCPLKGNKKPYCLPTKIFILIQTKPTKKKTQYIFLIKRAQNKYILRFYILCAKALGRTNKFMLDKMWREDERKAHNVFIKMKISFFG